MPQDRIGQLITFATEIDPDANYNKSTWVEAKGGQTIRQIAAGKGHPEWAPLILSLNHNRDVLPASGSGSKPRLHSTTQKLRAGAQIKLPGIMTKGEQLSVHAGDDPPIITAGYAKYDVVDVPGRTGINRFLGYDPIAMDIAVQFEAYASEAGEQIEQNIQILERMAGRGDYPGVAVGPPAVIRISVTDNRGHVVPLVPVNYQWNPNRQTRAPLWRISTIAWDAGALRGGQGNRIRQTGTVTVTEYTPINHVIRSVKERTFTQPLPKPQPATS